MESEYNCNGKCCEKFYLHLTPEQIQETYQYYVDTGRDIHDISIIGPMVQPLEKDSESSGWWYTCKHWDQETKLCNIYISRPQMCRDYPYRDACNNCGWLNKEYVESQEKNILPPGGVSGPVKEEEQ